MESLELRATQLEREAVPQKVMEWREGDRSDPDGVSRIDEAMAEVDREGRSR